MRAIEKSGWSLIAISAALPLAVSNAQWLPQPGERQAFVTVSPAHDAPMIVQVPQGGAWAEIFRLGAGGCLRGPLTFTSPDGAMVFSLGKDNDIPYGCSLNR